MLKVEYKNNMQWVDITQYVEQPIIINDNLDNSLDTVNLVLRMKKAEVFIPRTYFRINEDWLFICGDTSNSISRYIDGLYTHKIQLIELLKELEGIQCSNYTVTQDKSTFYENKQERSIFNYNYVNSMSQDHNQSQDILYINYDNINVTNDINGLNIEIIDNTTKSPKIKVLNTNKSFYSISLSFNYDKKARTRYIYDINAGVDYEFVPYQPGFTINPLNSKAITRIDFTITYYNSSDIAIQVINKTQQADDYQYILVKTSQQVNPPELHSLTNRLFTNALGVNIPLNNDSIYAILEIKSFLKQEAINIRQTSNIYTTYTNQATKYNNINIDIYGIKIATDNIEYKSLYDITQKILDDINYNRKSTEQYKLSENAIIELMQHNAPEMFLEGYNLKEVIYKLFNIANLYPVVGYKNDEYTIDVVNYEYRLNVSFDKYFSYSKNKDIEYFYSKGIVNIQNLVSLNDSVTEILTINSTSDDYSQLTDITAGFQTQYPIYFVNRAIIRGITLNATLNGSPVVLSGNTSSQDGWDIFQMLLEKDEYNALPDISMSNDNARKNTPENLSNALDLNYSMGKGNTIYFTSGERFIKGIGHIAPSVPAYWGTVIQQYSIVEMLARLAYKYLLLQDQTAQLQSIGSSDFTLDTLMNLTLEIEYIPILDTRISVISQNKDKQKTNSDRTMNFNDKVVDIVDLERAISENQNRMGNDIIQLDYIHDMYSHALDVGVVDINNYIITNRQLTIYTQKTFVKYVLQKDHIALSDDIALDIQYSRYLIPYEFIKRYVIVDRYIYLDTISNNMLDIDTTITIKFLADLFNRVTNFTQLLEYTTQITPVLKVTKIINRIATHYLKNGVTLYGGMIDNYSAGNRIVNDQEDTTLKDLRFSMPMRYPDDRGKVISIKYTIGDIGDPLNEYPNGNNAIINSTYLSDSRILNKDAREQIVMLYNFYYISMTDDIILINYNLKEVEQDDYYIATINRKSIGGYNIKDFTIVYKLSNVVITQPISINLLVRFSFSPVDTSIIDYPGLLIANNNKPKMWIKSSRGYSINTISMYCFPKKYV